MNKDKNILTHPLVIILLVITSPVWMYALAAMGGVMLILSPIITPIKLLFGKRVDRYFGM